MRTRAAAVFAFALTVPALLAEEGVKWASDWETARKQAVEQKKLIFIDFYADW